VEDQLRQLRLRRKMGRLGQSKPSGLFPALLALGEAGLMYCDSGIVRQEIA
jgi:hypothetical protein